MSCGHLANFVYRRGEQLFHISAKNKSVLLLLQVRVLRGIRFIRPPVINPDVGLSLVLRFSFTGVLSSVNATLWSVWASSLSR